MRAQTYLQDPQGAFIVSWVRDPAFLHLVLLTEPKSSSGGSHLRALGFPRGLPLQEVKVDGQQYSEAEGTVPRAVPEPGSAWLLPGLFSSLLQ